MDKKNAFLGILCIAAGLGFMVYQNFQAQQERMEELQAAATLTDPDGPASEVSTTNISDAANLTASDLFADVEDVVAEETAVAKRSPRPQSEESKVVLSNEHIRATLTTRGGAIETVEFLQTKRGSLDDYVFNQDGYLPALSLSLGQKDGTAREFALDYTIESQTATSVTFVLDAGSDFKVRRVYQIAESESEAEPYIIEHQTTFVNEGSQSKALSSLFFNLGTAYPISREMIGVSFLNIGYFDGDSAEFVPIKKLTGSKGFLGFGSNDPQDKINVDLPSEWTSVKNQFFASVLSSETKASKLIAYPVDNRAGNEGEAGRAGITANVAYSLPTIAANGSQTLDFDFYVGPKEYKRLQALGNKQDLVMEFGKIFGVFSKLLLAFMYAIHYVVPSWGWSIVIMTICIKLIFWPLTSKASRSQKRMAKLQVPMAEVREKHKNNPQKMQQEMMRLYKEHKVNPVAGCLPMIIQMPIFLGLFYMLRTASELRHEPFLWVSDLSMPDTVATIAGFPINLLPLIMGVTMFVQMSLIPASPGADPMQRKIFKFLPAVFLVFLYNFAAGLVLYWTVQNILTIIQQQIVNREPDELVVMEQSSPVSKKSKTKAKRAGKGRS